MTKFSSVKRLVLGCLVVALFGAGCGVMGSVGKKAFGTSATLSKGESVTYADGLYMTLVEFSDSRCPKDVVCIWAGEISAKLKLSRGDLGASEQELFIGSINKQKTMGKYSFSLQDISLTEATIVVQK